MKRTQRYTIDGQTYDSLEAMPPAVRRKWDALAPLLAKAQARLAESSGKTTAKFEERLEWSGGEAPAGAEAIPGAGPTFEPLPAADARARVLSGIVIGLLFATLFLAGWGFFSRVRITMPYGPGWWIASGLLTLSLTAGLGWSVRRARVRTMQLNAGTLLALLVGMAAISSAAVFGGVPVVAHDLTAVPGERIVSVIAKQERLGRYRCAPRVVIAEFTYVLRNYLCPGSRAFAEIQVGSKIRLEGAVSDYGVAADVFSWTKPN